MYTYGTSFFTFILRIQSILYKFGIHLHQITALWK